MSSPASTAAPSWKKVQRTATRRSLRALPGPAPAKRGKPPERCGQRSSAGRIRAMRLAVFVEPQLGASYADQLRIARHAEELGFEAFFRSDHFLTMGSNTGLPGPTDSWATL